MRSSKEIKEEIADLSRQKDEIDAQLKTLRLEATKSERLEEKADLYENLGVLGAALSEATWKENTPGYHNNPYTPGASYRKRLEKPLQDLRLDVDADRHYIWAYLTRWADTQSGSVQLWALNFTIGKYGTPTNKEKQFTGTESQAKEWAIKEIQAKLLDLKKKLSKELR